METSKKDQALTRILFQRLWQEYRQEVDGGEDDSSRDHEKSQTQGMYLEGTKKQD